MNTPPAIEQFLIATLGMAEDAVGKGAVSRAVQAAMRREGISDPLEYERLFVSSGDVRQRLIDDIVVGETWFFRDRGPFTYLARHARELRGNRVLNILSAPCSTGEEPYSIVMTLLAAGLPPSAFAVDGVDISIRALNKARQACYGSGAFRGHIGEDIARFFQETPHGRQVTDQVIRQVAFHHDNLMSPGSLAGRGPYAIIFCRNLLIYLTAETRRRVFERVNRLLLPGGILFTGHTETIFWQQQGYVPLQWDRAFALTKPASQPLPKVTTTATTLKSLPPLDAKRQAVKTLTGPGAASGNKPLEGKTLPDPFQLLTAAEKQQPAKPDPTDAEPFMDGQIQEARCLADRGDMDGALRLCQEYTRKVGPSAESYCLMGVIHMARQDMNVAEAFFLKAIYLDPGQYESLVHISLIYRQKGDDRKASLYRDRAERKAGMQGKTVGTSETPSVTEDIAIRTNG